MAYEAHPDVYTDFLAKIPLLTHDREALRTQRGFSDELIDTLRFRSGGPQNCGVIDELLARYGRNALLQCGLLDMQGQLAWQWNTTGKIILPYLATDGKTVYYLKSHKLGCIKDSGVRPYCDYLLHVPQPRIVLCESEFKAAALYQCGFRAIGIGGIATFTGKHLDKLIDCVKSSEEIIILFDTEIQDDPSLPSYKEDYKRRYAHHIWSYILGRRLELRLSDSPAAPKVRIASLPVEWTINGKVDIDTAMAHGKGPDAFAYVLNDALAPDVYRDLLEMDPKYRPWVMRQMERAHIRHGVTAEPSGYWVERQTKKGGTVCVPVSNFTMRCQGLVADPDKGIVRQVRLINQYGDQSPVVDLEAKALTSVHDFRIFCAMYGDFTWKGDQDDLSRVFDAMMLDSDVCITQPLQFVGRDIKRKSWVFANGIWCDDGSLLRPNAEQIFEGADERFQLRDLGTRTLPRLCEEAIDLTRVAQAFFDGWGVQGLIGFASTLLGLFSHELFEKYHCFPITLLHGEFRAGKSTLSDAMQCLVGFPSNQTAHNIADTTVVGMLRELQYFSSLPCRFDEYRSNNFKCQEKHVILRSIYNRQASLKGIKQAFGVRECVIRGTFTLIGEDAPSDAALFSRCLNIYLSPSALTPQSTQAMEWLRDQGDRLSAVTHAIVLRYQEHLRTLCAHIADTQRAMQQQLPSASSRLQLHYAMLMSLLTTVLGIEFATPHIRSLYALMQQHIKDMAKVSVLQRYCEDHLTMAQLQEPIAPFFTRDSLDPGLVCWYIQGTHQAYQQFHRMHPSRDSLMQFNTILRYLGSQPYVLDVNYRQYMDFAKRKVQTIRLNLDHPLVPEALTELFDLVAPKPYEKVYAVSTVVGNDL